MKIKPIPPNPKLDALIERAKARKMTPIEIDEQRRSWVRGNMMLDNPDMTAERVNAILHDVAGPQLSELLAEARNSALEEAAMAAESLPGKPVFSPTCVTLQPDYHEPATAKDAAMVIRELIGRKD